MRRVRVVRQCCGLGEWGCDVVAEAIVGHDGQAVVTSEDRGDAVLGCQPSAVELSAG